MTTADVPADGDVQIGAIRLPAGRTIHSNGGLGEPVAWATTEPVRDAGRIWAALSEAHAQSGLVPVLLSGIDSDPERPWDTQEFPGGGSTAQRRPVRPGAERAGPGPCRPGACRPAR